MLRTTRATSIMTDFAGAALFGALLLAAPMPASAQDALGGGNALDHNLNTEGTINPRAAQDDYRVRNLLVTNNVPGGRGFRGSVGYTAVGDFRGALGSDDLYQFRRESAFSAPAFINYGRTYEQLRFGRDLAALEYSRDFQGATLRDVQERPTPMQGEFIDARMRLDRISRSTQSLGLYESAAAGDFVGVTYDQEGRVLVARASSLTGIDTYPAESDAQQIGLTPYDMARIRQQSAQQGKTDASVVGQTFQPSFMDAIDPFQLDRDEDDERPTPESKITGEMTGGRIEGSLQGERIESRDTPQRVNPGQTTSYRDVLRRVVERYADHENVDLNVDPSLIEEFEAEYDELRRTLRGTVEHQIPGVLPEGDDAEDRPVTTEPDVEEEAPDDAQGDRRERPSLPSRPGEAELSNIDELAGALRHGQRISKLSAEDQNRFNELVAQAELSLRQGEFFLAERRFDRALRFNPGNPLATAGMGHAQMGSGLYLSAALTLRTLLTSNPEMIDVRYDEALIPARGRLESAITTLRERINRNQDLELNSFLLAYVGRLLDEDALMTEGLDQLAKSAPGDSLEQLLRAVWLGEGTPDEPQK